MRGGGERENGGERERGREGGEECGIVLSDTEEGEGESGGMQRRGMQEKRNID